MRGQIVSLSITCKINQAASRNVQNFIYFCLPSFESKLQTPPNFLKFFEETWKTSQQQTKFRLGKNLYKSSKIIQKLFGNI